MELNYKNIEELVNYVEFELEVNQNGTLSLVDTQHANLGGIESQEFSTYREVVDRLSTYFYDYILEPLCDYLEIEDYQDEKDLYNKVKHLDTNYGVYLLKLIVEGE